MRISLDLDGVLADTIRLWLDLYREQTGRRLSKEEVNDWDFWRRLGFTEREFYESFMGVWRHWERIPPTEPDLAGKVAALRRLGVVDIVTVREPETVKAAKAWLNRQGVIYQRLVVVPPPRSKVDYPYDVYIDDSPNVVLEAVRRGRRALLYVQPWNHRVPDGAGVVRVKSLKEAVEALSP